MYSRHLLFALALWLSALRVSLVAQAPASPQPTPADADLRVVLDRISAKAQVGGQTAESFAPEVAALEALLVRYKGQPAAEAAILLARARVALGNLRDRDNAKYWLARIVNEHPDLPQATNARRLLHAMSAEGQAEAAAQQKARDAKRDALVGQLAPDMEFTWSSRAGWQQLKELRGQVVVLDFWATWCKPCIASFPLVRHDAEHFAGYPVTILGVTELSGHVYGLEAKAINVEGNPAREYALTADFMKKHDMTWPVVFVAKQSFRDYYISFIPTVVIIDPAGKVRHVGLMPLTEGIDIAGKITAILKEFNLPFPRGS